jgi:hypothetical protein
MKAACLLVFAGLLPSACTTPDGKSAGPGMMPGTDSAPPPAKDAATTMTADGARPSAIDSAPTGGNVDAAVDPPGDGPAAGSSAGPPGSWARGIKVGVVEVAQAVFIKVGEGGAAVDRATWKAKLMEGRPLFVRVHVTPDAGFMARPLRAVVGLQGGSGPAVELEDRKTISRASDPEDLGTTFNVLFPAAAVKPQMGLTVSLYETTATTGPDPMPQPRFPAAGAADLGVVAGPMEVDIVFVPASTGVAIADTPARRKNLEDALYELYPVQKVNLKFHAPIVLPAPYNSDEAPWDTLRELRKQDNAPKWEYYHMLIAAADMQSQGLAGNAVHADPGVDNDGSGRVAWSKVRNNAIDGALGTTPHEITHNQGRPHSPGCNAGGADPMFPYPASGIGTNGYSLVTSTLKSQTRYKDYMSYCSPTWTSDYVWQKVFERVRALSAMKYGLPSP